MNGNVKMKVTFSTREDEKVSGGQNTWLCRFLPELRRHGIQPQVLCFTPSREEELPTLRSLRQLGIGCATSSLEAYSYTEQGTRWILERLAEDPPDVFVSNMVIPASYYSGRWLRESGIPTVGICHGGGMWDFYPGLLDEFVLGKADYRVSAYVCISKHLEQDVLNRRPQGVTIRSIPYGLAIPKDVAKKPNAKLRLVYVGQLVEERKRISELTRALCRVVREVPGTEALIYGDGPDRSTVEQILRNEGGGLPIHLVGFVENHEIRERLLECHAVVLLSDHEGLGLALLEGMACGLVPLAMRGAPGVTEFVRHDVTGVLVDDRDSAFVAAVRRLREDLTLWDRLARSSRAHVQSEYSDEVCIGRWLELLHKIVNNGGPRKPLRIPSRLNLPPVHPALATLDQRSLRGHQRLIESTRRLARQLNCHYRSFFGAR